MDQQDDINLINYLKIILDKKIIILVFFVLGIGLAAGVNFLYPVTYKAESTIEVGVFQYGGGGLFNVVYSQPIESLPQVIEKIKDGYYGSYKKIKINNPQGTNLVKIEIISDNPEDAEKTLKQINNSLLKDHNEKTDSQKALLEKNINYQKTVLQKTIQELQQKMNYFISVGQQAGGILSEIYGFKQQLENYDIEKQKNYFQYSKIIKDITTFKEKPNLILNLIFGGCLGIFLGLIFVFGREWWDKNKQRL